jgi:hypothetical protein
MRLPRLGGKPAERVPIEWIEMRSAFFFVGACPYRKTGVHFSGTCAMHPALRDLPSTARASAL